MKLHQSLSLILALALVFACASQESNPAGSKVPEATQATERPAMVAQPVGEMRKVHRQGNIYLASQPSPEDLTRFQDLGVVSVINMRKGSEVSYDMVKACADLGLGYTNPGWNGPDELTDDLIDSYRELLNSTPRPLLLHCASCNRVGPIWMAWQVLDRGVPLETATSEAKMAGMRTPAYESKALDYIARHKK